MLVSALIAGLNSAGREAWSIGLCPTPAVSVLIKKFGAAGGLMVSASHNPPEDNGIKIFNKKGQKISSSKQKLIASELIKIRSKRMVTISNNQFGKAIDHHNLL